MIRTVGYLEIQRDVSGGGPKSLLTLLERLDGSRYRPVVFCYGRGTLADHLSTLDIPVEILKRRSRWSDPSVITQILRGLRRHRVDLLHVNAFDIRAAVSAKLARCPFIGHLRVIFPATWVDRMFVSLSDGIIGVSQAVQDHFCADSGALRRKFLTVPNAVTLDGEMERNLKAELSVPPSFAMVLLLSRIDRWKGLNVALEAVRIALESHPRLHCVIAGTADASDADTLVFEKELRDQSRAPGLSGRVHFLGFREDAQNVIRQADVLVVPSLLLQTPSGLKSEGFGRVVVEAMALGTPVIASRVGGIPEIVTHGKDGILVTPNRPTELAEQLLRVLQNPDLSRRLKEAGRRRFREAYTVNRHLERIEAIYERILSRQR